METDHTTAQNKNINQATNVFSEEILNTLFFNVQEGIVIIDNEGNLIDINPEGLKIHGFNASAKEKLKNSPFSFHRIFNIEHRELPAYQNPVTRLLSCESFVDENYIVQMSSGSPEIYISYSGYPQYGNDGKLHSAVLFARYPSHESNQTNLTRGIFANNEEFKEYEKYQQQLKNDRELMKAIIDTIPVMIVIYDKRIHAFSINKAFETITG